MLWRLKSCSDFFKLHINVGAYGYLERVLRSIVPLSEMGSGMHRNDKIKLICVVFSLLRFFLQLCIIKE